MEVDERPEVLLARRVLEKYGLEPPVDVKTLVRRYASLKVLPVPLLEVDGVSIDIKVPGKTPIVVLNSSTPDTRQVFTLAHELGHLLIPWHVGTIVDQAESTDIERRDTYWSLEDEANRFAAELLMPLSWIEKLTSSEKDLAHAHKTICAECKVSAAAAAIRLAAILPAHLVYCVEQDGKVLIAGRTNGTYAPRLAENSVLDENAYSYAKHHFKSKSGSRTFHWWQLPEEVDLCIDDERTWREILDVIVKDIGYSGAAAAKFKSSINGVVAYANGSVKQAGLYTAGRVAAAAIQRFRDREEFKRLVLHPKFETFVHKRAEDLSEQAKE